MAEVATGSRYKTRLLWRIRHYIWKGNFERVVDFFLNNNNSFLYSSSEETRADIKDLKNSVWNIDLFNSKKEREEPVVSREYGGPIINTRQGILSQSIEMDDGRGVVNSQDPVLGPSPGQILQALTLAVANAGFDLERLEVMGDSFLKLATSIHIYCHSPNHFHEGKMTQMRVRQVSNSNLYQLGLNKSLPHLMTATKFLPKENWLPTCYLTNDDQVYISNHNQSLE